MSISRIHLESVVSSVFDSFRQLAMASFRGGTPLRCVMRVLGATSKALAQAVFEENWPLSKASIAISIRLSLGIAAMMNIVVENDKLTAP